MRLLLGEDELAVIVNALNEVCNGVEIDDSEFSARVGLGRAEARDLLAAVRAALDELPSRA